MDVTLGTLLSGYLEALWVHFFLVGFLVVLGPLEIPLKVYPECLQVPRKESTQGCQPEAKFNWTSLTFSSGNLQRHFMDPDAGGPEIAS